MAVAHAIGTQERGATCRICGQPALPVVRLCAQCKAALKRVRHDTVSQHMPMTRRARGGDRGRSSLPRVDADGGERHAAGSSLRGVRAPIAVAALVAVIGSAGYFIVQQIHAAIPPEQGAVTPAGTDRVSVAATPPPAVEKLSDPPALASTPMSITPDAGAPMPAKPKVATRVAKPAPAPVAAPAPEVRPEPPPAPVVVAAAAPPPMVRAPDRMQLLAQAFAQCPTDGVLARMVCEQKARVQFCDGYWGQVPMCPNGMPDRGLSH